MDKLHKVRRILELMPAFFMGKPFDDGIIGNINVRDHSFITYVCVSGGKKCYFFRKSQ